MKSEVFNIDCVEFMKQYPDNHWELAIVDVPYGIKWASKPVSTSGLRTHSITNKKSFVKGNNFAVKDWDNAIPKQEYFDDLFRVSKNQIIWGENYLQFNQKPISSGRIFWDKINGDTTFADGEIAWCS
jgi:site-specific DNA-methyltransferase (adenine-specific)